MTGAALTAVNGGAGLTAGTCGAEITGGTAGAELAEGRTGDGIVEALDRAGGLAGEAAARLTADGAAGRGETWGLRVGACATTSGVFGAVTVFVGAVTLFGSATVADQFVVPVIASAAGEESSRATSAGGGTSPTARVGMSV
jgi:hypothetical protein